MKKNFSPFILGLAKNGVYAAAWLLLTASISAADTLTSRDIKSGGDSRRFYLHFPNNQHRDSLPAVIVFHGGGGNAAAMVLMTGMNRTADAKEFVAVYPEGNPASRWLGARFETWNAGACCGSAVEQKKSDITFIAALIDDLVITYHIDPRRIYLTGISNGAQIAYRAACELSDRVAAIAPVASIGVSETCRPKRAVPILHIHGTADPCARYLGGTCGGCFSRAMHVAPESGKAGGYWPCSSVEEYLGKWQAMNRCSPPSRLTYRRGAAECRTFECADNTEITSCTIDGGGHTWPGGSSPLDGCEKSPRKKRCVDYDSIVGPTSTDLDANEMMWNFFSRHLLPPAQPTRTGVEP